MLNTHHLDHQWQSILKAQEQLPYYQKLSSLLQAEASTQDVFPSHSLIFSALEQTPLEKVRVVILGQDPYHKPGQAHGLAFSVNHGVKVPPSLKNIHILPPLH